MTEKNGTTNLMIWLAGCLFAAVIGAMTFMGNVVKANEDKTVQELTEVRAEAVEKVDDVRKELKADLAHIQAIQSTQGQDISAIKQSTEDIKAMLRVRR